VSRLTLGEALLDAEVERLKKENARLGSKLIQHETKLYMLGVQVQRLAGELRELYLPLLPCPKGTLLPPPSLGKGEGEVAQVLGSEQERLPPDSDT